MKHSVKLIKFELKILKDVAKGLRDIQLTVRNKQNIVKIAKGVGLLLMLTCFLTSGYLEEYKIVTILLGAFSGCIIGFGIITEMSIKQYPYIAKHINCESIQARIEEIQKEIGE